MQRLRSEPLQPLLALLLLATSAAVLWANELPQVPRAVLVVIYLLTAPGLAIVPFFGRDHWIFHVLLVLSLSVAIATLLATAMSLAGWWRVDLAVDATVALVVLTVLWRSWRDRSAVAVRAPSNGGAR